MSQNLEKHKSNKNVNETAQKLKFSIKDFFSKCAQIYRKLKFRI